MTRDLPLVLGLFVLFPPLFGWAVAEVLVCLLQLRALRRTGHVLQCHGLRGWGCSCRDY